MERKRRTDGLSNVAGDVEGVSSEHDDADAEALQLLDSGLGVVAGFVGEGYKAEELELALEVVGGRLPVSLAMSTLSALGDLSRVRCS